MFGVKGFVVLSYRFYCYVIGWRVDVLVSFGSLFFVAIFRLNYVCTVVGLVLLWFCCLL